MNRSLPRLAVLRTFCSTDSCRQELWYPVGIFGRAYATDGRIAIRIDGVDVPNRVRGDKPFPASSVDELMEIDGIGEKVLVDNLEDGAEVVLAAARDYWVSRAYRGDEDEDPVDELEDYVCRNSYVKIGKFTFAADKIAKVARALQLLGPDYNWDYRMEIASPKGMLRIWSADRRLRIVAMPLRDTCGAEDAHVGTGRDAATYCYDDDVILRLPQDL